MHDGPYPCHFKCGAKLRTKYNRIEVAGWMWFTGKGARTVHVCPACASERADEVRAMMDARGLTPPDDFGREQPYPRLRLEDEFPKIDACHSGGRSE
jgi:hypothetical protein